MAAPKPRGEESRIDALERQVAELQRRAVHNIRDQAGNRMIGIDSSGRGLARPYVPALWVPRELAQLPSTTSSSWVTLWDAVLYKQHPALVVGIACGCLSDSATTGEVALYAGGTQITDARAVPYTSTSSAPSYVVIGPTRYPGQMWDSVPIEIRARRTAGSGPVHAGPYMSYGVEL